MNNSAPHGVQTKPKGKFPAWVQWGFVVVIFIACALFLDVREIFDSLQNVSMWWVLGIVALMTIDRLVMAWKWSILLRALRIHLPLKRIVSFYYQGNFAGIFLPSSLGGDLLRAYLVGQECGGSPRVYASVVMEKMIGFISALSWAMVGGVIFAWMMYETIPVQVLGMFSVGFFLAIFMFLLSLHPQAQRVVKKIVSLIPIGKLEEFSHRLVEAYGQFTQTSRVLVWNGVITFLEHALQIFVHLAMAWSLGIQSDLLLFLAVTSVFLVIYRLPIAPDGWGVGEITAIGLYGLIGISAEDAFAMAFLAHIFQMIVVVPGLYFLWKSNRNPESPLPVTTNGLMENRLQE